MSEFLTAFRIEWLFIILGALLIEMVKVLTFVTELVAMVSNLSVMVMAVHLCLTNSRWWWWWHLSYLAKRLFYFLAKGA